MNPSIKLSPRFPFKALALALLLSGFAGNAQALDIPDTREVIQLTAAERNSILRDMRQYLITLQGMMNALSVDDIATVGAAARPLGGAAAATAATARLSKKLPEKFRQHDEKTRAAFDRIADTVDQKGTAREVFSGLAQVMKSCAACHSAFRIQEQ
ncbi:MAG TPA: hypothetical protein ENJ84_08080 [Gammaproteobacteria bacterium]|nr:hypothetical protein [Gammaproteobacteria bacterium]